MKSLKRIVIISLIMALLFSFQVNAEEELTIIPPKGREDAITYLTDNNPETHLTLERKQSVTISWDVEDARFLELYWYTPTSEIRIELLNTKGKVISQKVYTNIDYKQVIDVVGASSVRITAEKGMPCLSEATLYRSGETPAFFETEAYQADLMIICSEMGEETQILGGLIPLYAKERNIRTLIVYCGEDTGYTVAEGFSALETMEYTRPPIFMHKKDHNSAHEVIVQQRWGGNFSSDLFQLIRKVNPKVIVTVSPCDESVPSRSRYTAQVVTKLVNDYIPRANLSVQKVYQVAVGGTTKIDYKVPLVSFKGRSGYFIAKEAYAKYSSKSIYRKTVPDHNTFSLIYTTVGKDEACNDLFEHVDIDSLIQRHKGEQSAIILEAKPESEKYPESPYFRQDGEAEEVIVSDYDNGHWEYRSDTLSVIIDRETFTLNNLPECIYVAYIRTRGEDCFRAGLSSDIDTKTLYMPWRLARTYKAVLAITGDNLINAEEKVKGILIRNGTYYCDHQYEDSLAVYSSNSIGLLKKETDKGLPIFDSGVRNVYSFGPVLVENGELNPNASKHRVARPNPRCGVGMLKDGTIIAIVADGRDPNRAYNLSMDEFAQIFIDKGAEFAYNLDGGSSAAMVFMGESVSWHSGKDDPQRTWIDALMWGYSEMVPAVEDPVKHTGDGKVY